MIVADDGSSDGTAAMVEGLETPFALRVPAAREGRQVGGAERRDRGRARARVCLFLDDDIIASPELVAAHLEAHEGARALGIGAMVQRAAARPRLVRARLRPGLGRALRGAATTGAPDWTDCYGANFSRPADACGDRRLLDTEPCRSARTSRSATGSARAGCTPPTCPRRDAVHDDQKRYADARRRAAAGSRPRRVAARWTPTRATSSSTGRRAPARASWCCAGSACGCGVPARPLAWLGRFLPGEGRKMIWLHFVRRLAFWRGVRRRPRPRPSGRG